ncbi:hypothetical protein GJ629_14060 [Halapricum sp. CBA1109]|uniref:DUF7282 domain-containing protein n=1 Tax=Halapricum sp. CBA1109 TaxID=2668068 RepID=UPI0012FB02AF|nr:hypothetical protein [Halapricum sp. CBA1109]MUV90881.1 hypothetical protein [Halapricum sp. CBA1109]
MQRSLAALVLMACLAVALPVAAHVNDVEADSQTATDGEIAVESTSVPSDGFLVVHRVTDDGDPGEPIGHVPLEGGRRYANLGVTVAPAAWESWGDAREVWLVVHESGDDPGFDPDDDPIQRTLGGIAGERITVAKGSARGYVLAEDFEPKTIGDSATVRRVVAPERSRLELRVRRPSGPGPVVGERTLSAGATRTSRSPSRATCSATAVPRRFWPASRTRTGRRCGRATDRSSRTSRSSTGRGNPGRR